MRPSMYDTELVLEILSQIKSGAQKIERRFSKIGKADDFLSSEEVIGISFFTIEQNSSCFSDVGISRRDLPGNQDRLK